MPMVIAVLALIALAYQVFFRYEHWPSEVRKGIVYERDNLTGETHMVNPNQYDPLLARLFGYVDFARRGLQERSARMTEELAGDSRLPDDPGTEKGGSGSETSRREVIPVPKELVVAVSGRHNQESQGPPVPVAMLAATVQEASETARPYAVRKLDLNQDGQPEEIIQNALQSDGLLDISVVVNGREVFYGRGKNIALLGGSGSRGWRDIALKTHGQNEVVYRFDDNAGQYKIVR